MTTDYTDLSNRIKLLAHPERLRILGALRRDAECVCHLEALLGKPQPYVSQQLRILRDAGVITDEKQAQNVYYRLTDTQLNAIPQSKKPKLTVIFQKTAQMLDRLLPVIGE